MGLLETIRTDLRENRERVHIQGHLHLTKSSPAYCDVTLLRDLELESDVRGWLNERVKGAELMGRYRRDAEFPISTELPDHYAMRVLSGRGAICSGRNIFLFFPYCLGVSQSQESDCFGMELIDVWRNVFEQVVFPCARTVLGRRTLMAAVPRLLRSLDKTIYMASIFHEAGHRVGAFRVSPVADTRLRLTSFYLDVMGELSTDCLLVKNLSEFPEIAAFVTLQRLFWFGRRGFLDNPRSAWINQDNDSWITACLWNELKRAGVLGRDARGDWEILCERLPEFYAGLAREIESIGRRVLNHASSAGQNAEVSAWMKSKVEWNAKEGFLLPADLQTVFMKCSRFPEIPQFNPILNHEEMT